MKVSALLNQIAVANAARAKAEARTKELERQLALLQPGSSANASAIAVVKQEENGELAVELLREGFDYAAIISSLKARLLAGR